MLLLPQAGLGLEPRLTLDLVGPAKPGGTPVGVTAVEAVRPMGSVTARRLAPGLTPAPV